MSNENKTKRPVKDRLVDFRAQYPNGAIVTEAKDALEELFFVAKVYANFSTNELLGTGHYRCKDIYSFEKSETLAVGRALANAGFIDLGEDIASEEEFTGYKKSKTPTKSLRDKLEKGNKAKAESTQEYDSESSNEEASDTAEEADYGETETISASFLDNSTNDTSYADILSRYKTKNENQIA